MIIFEPFLLYALISGVGIAVLTGIMGCFVVWRRMAYFGDSLSHSALLGVCVGILTGLQIQIAIIGVCFLFSMLLVYLQQKKFLSGDTLLGILAHAALSFGMVALSFTDQSLDLHSFLFGDILAIDISEIYWIYGGGLCIIGLVFYYWSSFLLITLSQELAVAEGIPLYFMNVLFMLLMTLIVAFSMQIIGVLLITALLIIPAATARNFANSPLQMVFYAILFGILAVILGICFAYYFDTPVSPTIVSVAAFIFIFLLPLKSLILSWKTYHSRLI